jgi:hypothetical protein
MVYIAGFGAPLCGYGLVCMLWWYRGSVGLDDVVCMDGNCFKLRDDCFVDDGFTYLLACLLNSRLKLLLSSPFFSFLVVFCFKSCGKWAFAVGGVGEGWDGYGLDFEWMRAGGCLFVCSLVCWLVWLLPFS